MTTVYLNGEYVPRERAVIPVDDRGFIFGDGIYEGIRGIDGQLFEWQAHADRMVDGLAGLRIEFGADRVAALRGVCERLLGDNDLATGDAFLYLQVTRGVAPRVHAFPPAGTAPTVYVSATRLTPRRDLQQHGARAITHPDLRWERCDWKTINLIGSVLARQAAVDAGAFEAIMHRDGVVTEGASSTIFAVVDGVLRTHPLGHRILPSVTRKVVLDCIAARKLAVREHAVSLDELRRATEVFLCGTANDITPLVAVDGHPVGTGAPGPITAQLRDALDARLHARR
ncbi:MAG TPA: aminotransferase class IV [Kofleriaceae bacterium]|jgi:D-alanine transaminase|nr:aminotransferase class IV [Kofleriaceae bacterium]